jgi:hypothetical protein
LPRLARLSWFFSQSTQKNVERVSYIRLRIISSTSCQLVIHFFLHFLHYIVWAAQRVQINRNNKLISLHFDEQRMKICDEKYEHFLYRNFYHLRRQSFPCVCLSLTGTFKGCHVFHTRKWILSGSKVIFCRFCL